MPVVDVCADSIVITINSFFINGQYRNKKRVFIIFRNILAHMNILILPGAETLLSKQEVDWIYKTVPGNEKVLLDAIDFAVNHPETYVGILIGGMMTIPIMS